MTRLTVTSSQATANTQFKSQDLRPAINMSFPIENNKYSVSVDLVVEANTHKIKLTTRPVAMEKSLVTRRLNQSLELGYTPPIKSTSSK